MYCADAPEEIRTSAMDTTADEGSGNLNGSNGRIVAMHSSSEWGYVSVRFGPIQLKEGVNSFV